MKKPLPEHLEKELHPTKNGDTGSSVDLVSTSQTIWWLGSCNHEWEARIAHRLKGSNCPYCAGQKVLPGFNDLATLNPELAKEWDYESNNLLPAEITLGSAKNVNWVCTKGHKWNAPVKRRTRSKTGCPYCTGHKILAGFNDLPTLYPNLAKEWDLSQNNSSADGVSPNSSKKVWWQCEEKHTWKTSVQLRVNGSKCPTCMTAVSSLTRKTPKLGKSLQSLYPKIAEEWSVERNTLTPSQVHSKTTEKVWWKCDEGHEWNTRISDRTYHKTGCPLCVAKNFTSQSEQNLANYIRSFFPSLVVNDRSIIPGRFELDMYVPEKRLAVEFNGVYWHSEAAGKNKNYHYEKWLVCEKQGIQLIQIWEDDWNRNPELIKRMLVYKLGANTQKTIYARNTKVCTLSSLEAKTFLQENHIQGDVTGSIRIGLKAFIDGNEKLTAVMVLKVEPGTQGETLNLLRFATSHRVPGGFTKLLNHVERTYKPSQVVTFSDNTVSDGGLYSNNGFVNVKTLPPDYMYLVKGERVHKFNYRLKRFREDDRLLFEDGLSERELALLNKIPRIWDAGKTKWVKTCIV